MKTICGIIHISKLFLVTGTPHEEIMVILKKLNLLEVFNSVHGSPEDKTSIIKNLIIDQNLSGSKCIMIGDSYTDFERRRNNIDFVFRNDDNVTPDDITTDFLINNFNVLVYNMYSQIEKIKIIKINCSMDNTQLVVGCKLIVQILLR